MALKPASAKITDFETSFDAAPVVSAEGEVLWTEVRIDYVLAGLAPSVTIRVPVPWRDSDGAEQRRVQALQSARELIDHACRAAGMQAPPEPPVAAMIEDVVPSALEGLTQELGLARPTTRARKKQAAS
jgi:hypothetical protein